MEHIRYAQRRVQQLPKAATVSPPCWQALCDWVLRHPKILASDHVFIYNRHTMTAIQVASSDMTPFLTTMLVSQSQIAGMPSSDTSRCWHRPRLAGALRAINSMYMMSERDVPDLVLLNHSYVTTSSCPEEDLLALRQNGIQDVQWDVIAHLGCAWLRVLAAARSVQRGWRRHRARSRAARLIQARWRFVVARPHHPVCQRRLMRELNGLNIE